MDLMLVLGFKLIAGAIASCAFIGVAIGVCDFLNEKGNLGPHQNNSLNIISSCHYLADLIAVLGSADFVLGSVDRISIQHDRWYR